MTYFPPNGSAQRQGVLAGLHGQQIIAVLFVTLLSLGSLCRADSGVSTNGNDTVFQTGTNRSLVTLELPENLPSSSDSPRLTFDFGFASEEALQTNLFFDSFSITLQSHDQSATALLLTADRTGVQWAPPNPGGLALRLADLLVTTLTFPPLGPSLPFRLAYTVSFLLPPELTGRSASLFFDLFDNGDALRSLAFVSNVRVETTETNQPTVIALESSASASGPFAEEAGAILRLADRTILLPEGGVIRFFRLCGNVPSKLVSFDASGQPLRFKYAILPPALKLEAATTVNGPYAEVTNAVWNFDDQSVSVSNNSSQRYFRLRADVSVRIVQSRAQGGNLVVQYDVLTAQVALQSSSRVDGPFASEPGIVSDPGNRLITLPRQGVARFFRLKSDGALRIKSVTLRNGFWQFIYE